MNKILDLYVNKRMSSGDIAKMHGCCKATVLKRLKMAKIRVREPGRPKLNLTDDELRALYISKKMSTWKIADLLGCGRSTIHRKLAKMGLTRDISTAHIKYARRHFSGDRSEMAYMLGFAIGDLRVRKIGRNSKTIKIDCGSTKKDQINLIRKLFSKYGHVWVGAPTGLGKTQIEAFLDDSFLFLLNGRDNVAWALEGDAFAPFLAGFTDAEGSVFISNGKAAYSLGNYDHELLELIKTGLEKRSVSSIHLYKAGKKYPVAGGYKQRSIYWHIKINGKEQLLKLFSMLLPHMRHKKRIDDIKKALRNINLRNRYR